MHFYRYFTVMNAVLPDKQHYVHQQASTPGIDQSNTRRMGSPYHGTSNKISQSTANMWATPQEDSRIESGAPP